MDWTSILKAGASLRYQISRTRRKGIEALKFRRPSPPKARNCAPSGGSGSIASALRLCTFDRAGHLYHLSDRRLFVARRAGNIIAYLLCTPMPTRNGWPFEQWARAQTAPLGTGELLAHRAMATFGREGCCEVTMGLVPLNARPRTGRAILVIGRSALEARAVSLYTADRESAVHLKGPRAL